MVGWEDDLPAIRAALTDRLQSLVETLRGKPSRRNRGDWRWGSNGSLSATMRGRRRGQWFDHEAGVGDGDALSLIQHCRGIGFAEALAWARSWLGLSPAELARIRPTPRVDHGATEPADQATRIETARRMLDAAVPVAGTLGEIYLTKVRAIPMPASGWPHDAVRYHAASRSLIVAATTAEGVVQAVQRVRLTADGRKDTNAMGAPGAPPGVAKPTNGVLAGAAVRLPGNPSGPLLLAEGPETGFSVWAATGYETWFLFGVGMFRHAELPIGRRVILCRDDDRQHAPADKIIRDAVTTWRKAGVDVAVATPWKERRQDKSDFNDLLREHGAGAVLARILAHALAPQAPPSCRVPVAVARKQAELAVRRFFEIAAVFDPGIGKVEGTPPPVHGVKIEVGIGKSHAARRNLVAMLAEMRRKGDQRTVVLAVPTHRLGLEQASRIEALPVAQEIGLQVAVWRGRAALDPDHANYSDPTVPDADKARMCGNLTAVLEAQAHSLPVDQSACRRTVKQGLGEKLVYECPLYSACAYQAQRSRTADLWIVPHDLLFTKKPHALGEVAAVVVDESAWQAGLEGVTGRENRLALDALRGTDRRPRDTDYSADWATLQYHRSRILDALAGMTDGPITRQAIAATGLTAKDAAEARALELSRLVDPKIHPGMSRTERQHALTKAEGNRTILQATRFWRALEALLSDGGPAASGWAELATEATPEGPRKMILLRGRKPVRTGWQVPTLLIDALLDPELVRPFWPQLEMVADVQAEMPHQRIRQVIDRAYAKSRMIPLEPEKALADPEEARRRLRNLREARAIIIREARQHRARRILVVAQKDVRQALEALGPLPRNLVLAHHNAIAGRDEWGDVAALVVLGRAAPSPADVERMAMALTGAAVVPIEGWYQRAPASREMAHTPAMAIEADTHPDPVCEAIRRQTCEGELVQIIGRGRGVNRSAATPLEVLVMTDVRLPLPIHEAVGFADLAPNTADRMLAECGFAFETPRHAAAACPTLWSNWEAAKKAMDREATAARKKGTNPYEESLIGVCPLVPLGLRRVGYRRAGRGQGDAVAWFDPLMVADAETALARLLGPLAWCRVAADPGSSEQGLDTMPAPTPIVPPTRLDKAA